MEGEALRWVYLFYEHYLMCEWTHSLYKIYVDGDGAVEEPHLVAKFPNNGKFASGMRCGRLDSKLYILGGVVPDVADEEYNPNPPDYDVDTVFPRDVYVYDVDVDGGELRSLGAKLNTGKPCPCVFTANGMLYALGSLYCPPRVSFWELVNLSKVLGSINPSFECLDPTINEWRVLANPPVDKEAQWLECTVFESHQQVEIVAWEPSRSRPVRLIYDLRLGQWTRDLSHPIKVSAKFQEGEGGCHLYGLRPYGLPFKLTSSWHPPIVFEDLSEPGLGLVELSSTSKGWKNIFLAEPYVDCSCRLLLYAGNAFFCYIVAGAPPHPEGPDCWGYLPPDNHTRAVTVTVFKEINDNDDENGSAESFKAVILRSQQFRMTTPFYSMGELVGCFVVCAQEPQHSLQGMKKN